MRPVVNVGVGVWIWSAECECVNAWSRSVNMISWVNMEHYDRWRGRRYHTQVPSQVMYFFHFFALWFNWLICISDESLFLDDTLPPQGHFITLGSVVTHKYSEDTFDWLDGLESPELIVMWFAASAGNLSAIAQTIAQRSFFFEDERVPISSTFASSTFQALAWDMGSYCYGQFWAIMLYSLSTFSVTQYRQYRLPQQALNLASQT